MLKIEDLTLERADRMILQKISLTIRDREIYCILGPNGAGKSSLAYTLMGCGDYKLSSGRIFLDEQDITDFPIWQRAKMGITLAWQEPARFEGLLVKDYLKLGMKGNNSNEVEEALEGVLLDPDLYLKRKVDKTLSGGERKRIELAAIYTMRPCLAILDEPDSGVDMLALDNVMDFVRRLRDRGASVILITHHAEVAKIAERAALVGEGYLIKEGTTQEVVEYFESRCMTCPKFK